LGFGSSPRRIVEIGVALAPQLLEDLFAAERDTKSVHGYVHGIFSHEAFADRTW
jgi:hypothetical protein